MSESDLEKLGITYFGVRRKLNLAIQKLRETEDIREVGNTQHESISNQVPVSIILCSPSLFVIIDTIILLPLPASKVGTWSSK